MRRAWVCAWLCAGVCAAEEPSPRPLTPEEMKALEKALGADAAANAAKQPQPAPSLPSPVQNAVGRLVQSLNPDLSVIIDVAAGYYSDQSIVRSGDDPGDTGINLQELEVAFQATVDPYFRADVFLTIPNLKGIEVEEAYFTTSSLPWNLQLRAGVMRAAFGRQNTQHLHLQDFTRRPTMNALLLGPDGLRAPAVELSWLAPTPFYLLVTGEVLSVGAPDDAPVAAAPPLSFGGGSRSDFTYLANAKTFIPFSDTISALLGLSFASGKTSQSNNLMLDNRFSRLYGADLYFKWKPLNVSETYMSVAWQTEFILREIPNIQLDGALYSQVVWQLTRRLLVGVRGEIDGLPSHAESAVAVPINREYAAAGSVTFVFSEFARVRAYGDVRFPDGMPTRYTGFIQLEGAIGAHGAHPY